LEDGAAQNLVAGIQRGAAQLGISGWQIRILAEGSRRLDGDRQLTLGADLGLRGWDPDYFDGTGRSRSPPKLGAENTVVRLKLGPSGTSSWTAHARKPSTTIKRSTTCS